MCGLENIKRGFFEIVDTGSHYILKPQTMNYEEVTENEDVTMRLAINIVCSRDT